MLARCIAHVPEDGAEKSACAQFGHCERASLHLPDQEKSVHICKGTLLIGSSRTDRIHTRSRTIILSFIDIYPYIFLSFFLFFFLTPTCLCENKVSGSVILPCPYRNKFKTKRRF